MDGRRVFQYPRSRGRWVTILLVGAALPICSQLLAENQPIEADQSAPAVQQSAPEKESADPQIVLEASLLRAPKPVNGIRWDAAPSSLRRRPGDKASPQGAIVPHSRRQRLHETDRTEAPNDFGPQGEVTTYRAAPLKTCVLDAVGLERLQRSIRASEALSRKMAAIDRFLNSEFAEELFWKAFATGRVLGPVRFSEELSRDVSALAWLVRASEILDDGAGPVVVTKITPFDLFGNSPVFERQWSPLGSIVKASYGTMASFVNHRQVPVVVAVTWHEHGRPFRGFEPRIECVPESLRLVVTPYRDKDRNSVKLRYSLEISEVAWPIETFEQFRSDRNGSHTTQVQMPKLRTTRLQSKAAVPLGSSLLVGGMTWTDSEGGSHPLYVLISARAVEK